MYFIMPVKQLRPRSLLRQLFCRPQGIKFNFSRLKAFGLIWSTRFVLLYLMELTIVEPKHLSLDIDHQKFRIVTRRRSNVYYLRWINIILLGTPLLDRRLAQYGVFCSSSKLVRYRVYSLTRRRVF